MEDALTMPHRLTLAERKNLTLTGAVEVISFDENAVVVKTELGQLTVHGKNLQLKNLSPDNGQLAVEGQIGALLYEEPRATGKWGRLFR